MTSNPMTTRQERIDQTAQAIYDAHVKSWGGDPTPLDEACDADYYRDLAEAALDVNGLLMPDGTAA